MRVCRFLIALVATLSLCESVYGRLGEPVVEDAAMAPQEVDQVKGQGAAAGPTVEAAPQVSDGLEVQVQEYREEEAQREERKLWDKNADVFILVDGGSSIAPADFATQKAGLITAIQSQDVVPRDGSVAIGIVQYGASTRVEVEMTLVDGSANLSDILTGIQNMRQMFGPSNAGAAVNLAAGAMSPRRSARQVFVLTTDEIVNAGPDLGAAVKAAKRSSWKLDVFSVLAFSNTITDAQFKGAYNQYLFDGQLVFAETFAEFAQWIAVAAFGYPSNGAGIGDGTPAPPGPGPVLTVFPPNPTVPGTVSDPFNSAPTIVITQPASGQMFDVSERIKLLAVSNDLEDGALGGGASVQWFLDNDFSNAIATGGSSKISRNTLLPGRTYTLTAVATDSRGAEGRFSIFFFTRPGNVPGTVSTVLPPVTDRPTITITEPFAGQNFAHSQRIKLLAVASDAQGSPLGGGASVQWFLNDNRATAVATGASSHLKRNTLPNGWNKLEAIATDGRGTESFPAVVNIWITGGPTLPTQVSVTPTPLFQVTVSSPPANREYAWTESVVLYCAVSDPSATVWWDLPNKQRLWGSYHTRTASSFGPGIHTAVCTAVSGTRSGSAAVSFSVLGPNQNLQVTVDSPIANSNIPYEATLTLKATVTNDPFGQAITWWTLPNGNSLYGTLHYLPASSWGPGLKTITVRSSPPPGGGPVAVSTVTFRVLDPIVPPTTPDNRDIPTMISPAPNANYTLANSIPLIASTNFPSTTVLWTFPNTPGAPVLSGRSTSILGSRLGLGMHTVTVTATTFTGLGESVSVVIRVVAGQNEPPNKVTILEPSRNDIFHTSATIQLSGTATDPEDGILSGTSLQWFSDWDGYLGDGQRLETPALGKRLGRHMITLRATDQFGAIRSHSVPIQITQGPIVLITRPQSGLSFNQETIQLAVDVRQWVGGAVLDADIVWWAIPDGADLASPRTKRIGTGRTASTTTAFLGVENFEIMVVAKTTDNLEGRDSIFITVTG